MPMTSLSANDMYVHCVVWLCMQYWHAYCDTCGRACGLLALVSWLNNWARSLIELRRRCYHHSSNSSLTVSRLCRHLALLQLASLSVWVSASPASVPLCLHFITSYRGLFILLLIQFWSLLVVTQIPHFLLFWREFSPFDRIFTIVCHSTKW